MGVPASEVGYTSATAGRGDHEVHKEHVVALVKNIKLYIKWHFSGAILYFFCFLHFTYSAN
jgi:hypothetical protein